MSRSERDLLAPASIGDDPEVGLWLAAVEDGRRDTLRQLQRGKPQIIGWCRDAPRTIAWLRDTFPRS